MTRHEIPAGHGLLVAGPARLKIAGGSVDVVGFARAAGQELAVPAGKSIPCAALGDGAAVETDAPPERISRLDHSSIPEDWLPLAERAAAGRAGTVVVLGTMDTGKSFLCAYLANRVLAAGGRPAIVDCDLGQSDIGPPGTIGLALPDKPLVTLADAPESGLYFVGAHSAGAHLTTTVNGTFELTRLARAQADVVLVNTSGFVHGDGGRLLKGAKLELVAPDLVVLMQRDREVEHLTRTLPAERIMRLRVSRGARDTTQIERRRLREAIAGRYLARAAVVELAFERIRTERAYFLSGLPVREPRVLHAEELPAFEGLFAVAPVEAWADVLPILQARHKRVRLILPAEFHRVTLGLCDEDRRCLGMGLVEEVDFGRRRLRIWSTVPDPAAIRIVQFGSLRLEPDGTEAGFVPPGRL